MTPTRIVLSIIVMLFIVAEVARPTRIPAKRSERGLIVHAQAAAAGTGVYGSLDANLLDDLPRIHPNAAGEVMCLRERGGAFRLFGAFHGGDDGSAVFVIRDGARLGAEATLFGNAARPHVFMIELPPKDLDLGKHRLHVALVSSDQRGFFLLPQTIAITVGESSHESDRCGVLRSPDSESSISQTGSSNATR